MSAKNGSVAGIAVTVTGGGMPNASPPSWTKSKSSKTKLTKDDINRLNAGTIINLRRAVADYMAAMEALDLRDDAETRLASLLDVPEQKGGGWNWEQYRTPR